MQLVNKARVQWSPHLAAAPLQFLYVAGVLCVQIDDAVRLESCRDDQKTGRKSQRRRIRPFLRRPRIVLPADFRPRAIHAHHLSYYGGHFGLARQRSCVSSPMHFLHGQHAVFEAVALAQPSDRHAFRDRGGRHLWPTQTHGQGTHPYTRTYRPPHPVDGAHSAARTHRRVGRRTRDIALRNNEGAPD